MKTRNIIPLSCALLFLALLPKVQGASETALPGFNTADGDHALSNVSTGIGNSAFGWYSLFANSDGAFNTGVGAGTLALNVGNQSTGEGTQNTAVGAVALLLNSKGQGNTAVGASALLSNDSTGNGFANFNSAFGAGALENNTDGGANAAVGFEALKTNTTGQGNTAVGASALFSNTTGFGNTALGIGALFGNVTGSNNTAVGAGALHNNTDGIGNTAVGLNAGLNQTTGSNNIYIGDSGVPGESNVIAIGGIASSGTAYTDCFIGAVHDSIETDQAVFVGVGGHLGTAVSSQRYKDDVQPMGDKSQALFSLKPVTFRYKKEIDPSQRLSFGLIAEQVAAISPDLVSRDRNGQPRSVRYEAVNAMLLNEFLKEHKRVQSLEATVARQQKSMEELTAQLKEQAAQLQKVSAQLEIVKPATRVALTNQ